MRYYYLVYKPDSKDTRVDIDETRLCRINI